MFKSSKHKKNVLMRGGLLGLAFAILSIFGGLGFSPILVSAQENKEQTHFCEEANGKFVQQKDPCIAKEIIKCEPGKANNPCADPAAQPACKSVGCSSLISDYVEPGIRVLAALVGLVVAISLVVAGILYGSAGSDPGKVAAAKKRFTSSLLALVAYLFTFSFLQWLLPGGIL